MGVPLLKEELPVVNKIWSRDFIMIFLANFFVFLSFQMTSPTLPLFVKELGGNERYIGLVAGMFLFSALIVRPFAGQALETKGRRFVFLFGLAILAVAIGSFGFMMSIFLLCAMRILQGIGWGYTTTASGTIASDLIPAKRRGEGMGYFTLSGNLAMAFGPSFGLFLADVLTFQHLFLFCGVICLAAWIMASTITYKKVDASAPVKTNRFDIYEKSAVAPSVLVFFITVTFGGTATFLPLYTIEKGLTGIQGYFFLYALALIFTRMFAGKIYDQKGHQAVFIPSTLLIVVAMLLLAWMPSNMILYMAAILYGIGFGAVQPALQAWSLEHAARNRKGMANATFYSFFDLGIGFGAILFGQIGYLFGYISIYIMAAVSVGISMVAYLWILRKMK
ncbi:MFS transporter [Peribacillus frigoritolerans]|uniref:MFS transporter n=1 Tax=Peribacillus frigoritolerans TaxID=450367 RepID=UPI00207AFA44|nr:MFS transporter [Peribacillus frigoritolerans]USK73561.1 MFS transporter [Peribacillus frigoritolerans]